MSAFKPMVIATLVLSLVQPLSSLAAGFDPAMTSPNDTAPPTSGEMVADMLGRGRCMPLPPSLGRRYFWFRCHSARSVGMSTRRQANWLPARRAAC